MIFFSFQYLGTISYTKLISVLINRSQRKLGPAPSEEAKRFCLQYEGKAIDEIDGCKYTSEILVLSSKYPDFADDYHQEIGIPV